MHYVPHGPREEFIVPLLRREIEFAIQSYATPPIGSSKAIDVGCGGQPFRELLESVGYSYCGVDANPMYIAVDEVWAVDEPIPGKLRDSLPFDFVLCTEVLEHVADWDAAFANISSLLSPGGRALITAPHFYQLHEEPYDFWRPTLHAIDFYARRNALTVIQRRAAGDAWDVIGTLLANCYFMPMSMRFRDRLLAKAARVASKRLRAAMQRRRIQASVRAEGPLYISNVAVLEKPRG